MNCIVQGIVSWNASWC